ncbi:unnamed protein product [Adineta steineri]|uniref:Uncharacterized protein n=1 Tax=Adineta steineri TaxID=433720 RepID=A0A815D1Z3_9BILA|nr:unnamed protein product [Adineta steineri]CAF1291770.1 unnamed protein product [Adineta steineri]
MVDLLIAGNLFYQLRNEMRQIGEHVPRDISISDTLITQNKDEYEPFFRHPADEQPELISWTPTALQIQSC